MKVSQKQAQEHSTYGKRAIVHVLYRNALSSFNASKLILLGATVAVVVLSTTVILVSQSQAVRGFIGVDDQHVSETKGKVDAEGKEIPKLTEAQQKEKVQSNTSTLEDDPNYTGPKYSTSSDPRSTAYSKTPVGPSYADVNIQITRNNQVTAGTLITQNSTKKEKGYYGGDIVASAFDFTYDNTGNDLSMPVTLSAPGGQLMTVPMVASGSTNQYFGITFASQPLPQASSYQAYVLPVRPGSTPPGTYQLHLHASRAPQSADAWYHDLFITITVK